MTPEQFERLISQVTGRIQGKALDANLDAELNREFPPSGELFRNIFEACKQAVAEGWMCNREAGGIKFGRVIKPGPATHDYSVDVVKMVDVAGPHHRHPNGEIDMIMPLTPGAEFDGRGQGWLVYGPDTAHRPTVNNGKALVLYLLPKGAIEFSRS